MMKHTTLEQDIESLEVLHALRTAVYKMRDDGLDSLAKSFESSSGDKNWGDIKTEPNDLIYPAILRMLTSRGIRCDNPEAVQKIDQHLARIVGDPVAVASKANTSPNASESPKETQSSVVNNVIEAILSPKSALETVSGKKQSEIRCEVEYFQAARVLRSGFSSPTSKPLHGFFAAYYALLKEMNSVAPPFWMMGSIRAKEGAIPSAFVTGEACRAINAYARSIEATKRQAETLLSYVVYFCKISCELEAKNKWAFVDLKRETLAVYNSLLKESSRSIVSIDLEQFKKLIRELDELIVSKPLDLEDQRFLCGQDGTLKFLEEFVSLVVSFCEAINGFCRAGGEQLQNETAKAESLWNERKSKGRYNDSDRNTHKSLIGRQCELNHDSSITKVREANSLLKAGAGFAQKLTEVLFQGSNGDSIDRLSECDWNENKKRLVDQANDYVSAFGEAAQKVRKGLQPSKHFVESILDRELTNSRAGKFNAPELVFAASALATIDPYRSDNRFIEAIEKITTWLQGDGLNDSYSYLDTDDRGYSLVLVGSEVVRAIGQLIARVDMDLDTKLFECLVGYFRRNEVLELGSGRLVGWSHDRPRYPVKAHRWTTGLALLALDRIGRVLDKRINRRVQRHFATKKASDLCVPKLSSLCYPDYGVASLASRELFKQNINAYCQSVSFYLERARSHLTGSDFAPGYNDACYSMLLFGPPGTGKTTLLESLALTANVDLIEITPSDILLEGEAWLEKRAKTVFRALSFLTNSVVVFDEFDPVLRSRELDNARNAYSFLTPGMLPKLKDLNSAAKNQRVVFALITNRIGTLDEAAIRSGRFDHKIGVFPPDLLSRQNSIAQVVEGLCVDEHLDSQYKPETHFNCVIDTAGLGMTFLAKQGNFKPVSADVFSESQAGRTLMHACFGKVDGFVAGTKDAKYHDRTKFDSDLDEYENNLWRWVIELDEKASVMRERFQKSDEGRRQLCVDSLASLFES